MLFLFLFFVKLLINLIIMKTIKSLKIEGARILKKQEMKEISGGTSKCCYSDGMWTSTCGGSCEVWCTQLYGSNAYCM